MFFSDGLLYSVGSDRLIAVWHVQTREEAEHEGVGEESLSGSLDDSKVFQVVDSRKEESSDT